MDSEGKWIRPLPESGCEGVRHRALLDGTNISSRVPLGDRIVLREPKEDDTEKAR